MNRAQRRQKKPPEISAVSYANHLRYEQDHALRQIMDDLHANVDRALRNAYQKRAEALFYDPKTS